MKNLFQKSVAVLLTGAMVLSTAQAVPFAARAQESAEAVEKGVQESVTQFMDCMEPMPIIGELSDSCWGAAQVGARDQDNGLEDRTLENYCYWDGGILKDEETGKYYMFASRWNQAGGHWGQDGISGWQGSQAIYAVSDNLYGPYTDMGPLWPDWCEGAGHNVFPFELSESDPLYKEGYRYAISISDTGMHGDVANGTIHISKSLEGPWELIENGNSGKLKAEGGEGFGLSNISIMVRPDGRYQATNRNGDIALADSVAGTWEVVENGLWWKIENMSPENVEDPVIWYSDGLYHIVANKWDARMAYYMTSEDGITNWTRHPGTAYRPGTGFLRYEDGTINNWTKLERPNIYVEDGKIKAMTFAVIDVQKEEDFGNDQHGSKIIVVPFSSDKLQQLDAQPNPLETRSGILPTADTTIQTWGDEAQKNYGAEQILQLQKDPEYESLGNGRLGEGTKPYNEYDNKISLLKYDLSQYDLSEPDQIKSAYLSLVYKGRAAGDAETTGMEAVLADADWEEGTGRESVNGNWTEGVTWNTQPDLYYDQENIEGTVAQAEEFNMADLQRVVQLDVTDLVQQFVQEHPDEDEISFAVNVTETGNRFQIYSREAGDQFAPRLTIQEKVTVTYTAGEGGRIQGTEVQEIGKGESTAQVTAVAEAGYEFVKWDDGFAQATRSDENVQADAAYTAIFQKVEKPEPEEKVTVTYTAGEGGRIEGTAVQTVNKGGDTAQVTAVAEAGYEFSKWSDGKTTAARTDVNVQQDAAYTAVFVKTQVQKPGDSHTEIPSPAATGVKLSEKKIRMGVKEKVQLKASVSPKAASQKVSWKSSNKSVVAVSGNGKLTAKKTGTAKITVTTENGKAAICRVVVKKAPKKITAKAAKKTLKKGKSFQIKVKLPKNTASYKIRYTSNKKSVASVNANGKVTAKKKGRAVITIKTYNNKKVRMVIHVK